MPAHPAQCDASTAHPLGRIGRLAASLTAMACVLCTTVSARAQDAAPASASTTSRGPAGPAPGVIANEVVIKLEQFGCENQPRSGEWIGVRVSINDATTKQRTVLVRFSCEDTDGDTPVYQRELTTNPGTAQSVWLYGRIPYGFGAGSNSMVSVLEAIDSGNGNAESSSGGSAFRAGRLLGQLPISTTPAKAGDFRQELIGVFGARGLGLEGYRNSDPNSATTFVHPFGNESAELVTGMTPNNLPDRWMGLAAFDVILWGQGKPEELRGERARAMREWVQRGGHLVIVLPAAGQTWTTPAANELYDLMPMVSISRVEAESMKAFSPLFQHPTTPVKSESFSFTGTVHYFQPLAEAELSQAMRILNGPDGRCIVARRIVGAGAVTLIGVNLNSFADRSIPISADIFWHRVLGRRGDLTSAPPQNAPNGSGQMPQRDHVVYDEFLGPAINQTGRSAAGVLLGFVVFVLYWLVAGPGGFAILKRRTQHHHAWLFFVVAGAAFTALAWTGASLLRPRRIDCRHITFIDHVYGQPTDRARVWGSVLVPWYGEATLSIGEPGSRGNNDPHHSLNALSAWDPQEDSLGIGSSFPDSRAYYVDARQPDSMTFPSRSTVKQFRADWAGGPRWPMPFPVNPDGSPGKLELLRTNTAGDASTPAVRGTLVNKLPKTLTDIAVIVVPRQRTVSALGTNSPPASAEVYYPSTPLPWRPDETLDLEVLTSLAGSQTSLAGRRFENWVATLLPRTNSISTGMASGPSADIALNGLAFFSMLPPAERTASTNLPAATRKHSHGWDLGRWFTQPCVIVVARLVDAETPVPLMIDGKPFPSTGTTVVRWIYPFPDNPPDLAATADADKTKP